MSIEFDRKVIVTAVAIIDLLDASGPQTMGQILAEVKRQAYASVMAESLRRLIATKEIYYDNDDEVFESTTSAI